MEKISVSLFPSSISSLARVCHHPPLLSLLDFMLSWSWLFWCAREREREFEEKGVFYYKKILLWYMKRERGANLILSFTFHGCSNANGSCLFRNCVVRPLESFTGHCVSERKWGREWENALRCVCVRLKLKIRVSLGECCWRSHRHSR